MVVAVVVEIHDMTVRDPEAVKERRIEVARDKITSKS
jgi:hypothetical protein